MERNLIFPSMMWLVMHKKRKKRKIMTKMWIYPSMILGMILQWKSHRKRIGQNLRRRARSGHVLVPLFKTTITPVHHHQDDGVAQVAQGHAHMIEESIEAGLVNGPGHQSESSAHTGLVPGVVPETERREALMDVQGGLAPEVESVDYQDGLVLSLVHEIETDEEVFGHAPVTVIDERSLLHFVHACRSW